jgi:hypothetical protein
MKLQIEIELGDAPIFRVIEPSIRDETAGILRHLADNLENLWTVEYLRFLHRREKRTPPSPWVVKDVNGNAVGHAHIAWEDHG